MSAPSARPSRSKPIPAGNSPSPHRRAPSISASPSRAALTARLATPIAGTSPTPGQSEDAGQDQDEELTRSRSPLAGAPSSPSVAGPGPSSLSQALRGGLTPSPHRSGLEVGRESRGRYDSPDRWDQKTSYGSLNANSAATQLGRSPKAVEDLEVLKRHLVNPGQASPEVGPYRRPSDAQQNLAEDDDFSSLQLQGGDTTRHIYRYAEKREREEAGRLLRSKSVHLTGTDSEEREIEHISKPGGFRREHIRRTAASPTPSSLNPRRRDYGSVAAVGGGEPVRASPQFVASNFIEFLTLYGHFAGETLDEDDEILEPDEYFSSDAYEDTIEGDDRGEDDRWGEESALLTPGKRRRKRKTQKPGTGSPLGAALLLLKSFVGTGVLFLPRAFLNGGMLFSNLVLLFIAILSYYCFLLLVSTRLKVHASFGDMGGHIYGPHFRNAINFSLVVSQIGFSSAYIVFVGENLQAFILAVSQCITFIDIKWVILMQMIIFLPLSLYRNINHIQKMALAADLFILLGLVYLYFYDIKTLVNQGGVSDIKAFNAKNWTLFIGTAIFTFEGIGLIIPIQSGMKDPTKFPRVLGIVMIIVSATMITIGALSYAAYGSHTRTVVLLNMPQDDKLVNSVQFIYSLAILLSTPLQIYPAIEITSQQLFSKTGKYNPWIKWQKNIFRFFMVMLCAAIAWMGANDLDKFVALVGSFACVPLVYIYPPLMHLRVAATKPWQRVSDILLVIFGFCVMAYTTVLTITSWIHGGQVHEPGYCDQR